MTSTRPAPDIPPSIQLLVGRLVHAFAPERIVLCGSRAKGTAGPSSDVDMLVIANLPGDPASHMRRARQLALGCFPPTDIGFAAPADFADGTSARTLFLISVLSTGIDLYRRAH